MATVEYPHNVRAYLNDDQFELLSQYAKENSISLSSAARALMLKGVRESRRPYVLTEKAAV